MRQRQIYSVLFRVQTKYILGYRKDWPGVSTVKSVAGVYYFNYARSTEYFIPKNIDHVIRRGFIENSQQAEQSKNRPTFILSG